MAQTNILRCSEEHPWLLLSDNSKVELSYEGLYGPQSLKYLLFDPLLENSGNTYLDYEGSNPGFLIY